jgi:magnesium-transporting ATPase (P-type)
VLLICKGADNVVLERLARERAWGLRRGRRALGRRGSGPAGACSASVPPALIQGCRRAARRPLPRAPCPAPAASQPLLPATSEHLATMSGAGFRTLVVASKAVPASDYEAWAAEFKAASSALNDRESKVGRGTAVEGLAGPAAGRLRGSCVVEGRAGRGAHHGRASGWLP